MQKNPASFTMTVMEPNKNCGKVKAAFVHVVNDLGPPRACARVPAGSQPLTSSGSESLNSQPSPVQLMKDWQDLSVSSSRRNCHSWMGPVPAIRTRNTRCSKSIPRNSSFYTLTKSTTLMSEFLATSGCVLHVETIPCIRHPSGHWGR